MKEELGRRQEAKAEASAVVESWNLWSENFIPVLLWTEFYIPSVEKSFLLTVADCPNATLRITELQK